MDLPSAGSNGRGRRCALRGILKRPRKRRIGRKEARKKEVYRGKKERTAKSRKSKGNRGRTRYGEC
jgi:hypothetical protein